MSPTVSPGGKGFGWLRQAPDSRDRVLGLAPVPNVPVYAVDPAHIPPVRDQGRRGSCAAFATTADLWSCYLQEGYHHAFPPSVDFQYYNVRDLEGTQDFDAGSTCRDNYKVANRLGMCAEHWAPYDDDPGTIATPPPNAAYANAQRHRTLAYLAVPQEMNAMLNCLAHGHGFIIGFIVRENFFDTGPDGIVPVGAGAVAGGHAVWVCGYAASLGMFRFQNSWGASWGAGGYGYMRQDVLLDPQQASDFWSARTQA